jgi:hypothetical protein
MKFKSISFGWTIQDGKLDNNTGRFVIFDNYIEVSSGPSRDHNDILRSMSSKYRLNRDEVISNAYRFYWKNISGNLVISPVRKLDEDWVYSHREKFVNLLQGYFK